MTAVQIILGVVMLIVSIAIIGIVILQKGNRYGVNSAISGSSDTFFSKNESKTNSGKLVRLTKILAVAFFVIAIIASVVALAK